MKNWDNIYLEQMCKDAVCCDVLRENMHLLPQGYGRALDLACGMGGNAISLAQGSKLEVCAWDISSVAISKISRIGNGLIYFKSIILPQIFDFDYFFKILQQNY